MTIQKTRRSLKYKFLLTFLFIFLFSFKNSRKDNPRSILLDNLSTQLAQDILNNKKQCITLTVIKNDSIVYFKGFGHMDKRHKTSPDTSTIFRLGSITKSFTSVLMFKLIEEGYFKLDDPIEKYLPEIKTLQGYTDETKITFRQLATHTSGLEREPTGKDLLYCSTSEWESKILSAISETRFVLKPNTAMLYSNIGYNILGLAISRAAKVSFMKLVNDRIFIPLGMHSSYFEIPKDVNSNLAISNALNGTEHAYKAWKVASGGIYSTSWDLSQFVCMLMGTSKQKILSDKSLTQITQMTSKNDNSSTGYAYGIMVYDSNSEVKMFGHNGSSHGYKTCFAFDNLRKNGVIIMVNFDTKKDLWSSSIYLLKQLSGIDHR